MILIFAFLAENFDFVKVDIRVVSCIYHNTSSYSQPTAECLKTLEIPLRMNLLFSIKYRNI